MPSRNKKNMEREYYEDMRNQVTSAMNQDFASLEPIDEKGESSKSVATNDTVVDSGAQQRAGTRLPSIHRQPGAVRVRGPEWEEGASVDEGTVQIGSAPTSLVPSMYQQYIPSTAVPFVDSVVGEPIEEPKRCSFREMRKRKSLWIALLLLLMVAGVVLGVVFGVVLKDDDTPSAAYIPLPPTPFPTMAPTITMSPTTTKTWVEAGDIATLQGATMTLSPSGNRVAFIDSRFDLDAGGTLQGTTIVRVYQEENEVWNQLGNTIDVNDVTSLSLMGDRLAVGISLDNAVGVSVYELQSNTWNQLGDTIDREGWTVALAQDGNVVVVESTNQVQLYQLDGDRWSPRGDSISTSSARTNEGSAYSRTAIDEGGTILLVEQSVYKFSDDLAFFFATKLNMESDPPNTPVAVSGDGKLVTIAQPQSGGSGKVAVFRFDGTEWQPEDVITGDVENGMFGWSQALSGNGTRMVIMNNPTSGDDNKAVVLGLRGSNWVPVLEDVPLAVAEGTAAISEDGERVAVGGEGVIAFYDIVDGQ